MQQNQISQRKKQTLADLLDLDDTNKKHMHSFDMSYKQFTHDQGYQDLMSMIHFQRTRNATIKAEILQMKKELVQKYLAKHFQQLQNLSKENQELRSAYRQQVVTKNNYNSKQPTKQLTPKQSFQQIRTYRKSIPNANFATQFSGINNKQTGMRMSYKPVYESTSNLGGGTSLMPSPKRHKRRDSQLTERKDYPNQQYDENSYIFEERMSETHSLKNKSNFMKNAEPSNNNIFVQFLSTMLAQQKLTQVQIMQDMQEQILNGTDLPTKGHVQHVNQLQTDIKLTSKKLQNLQLVIKAFQTSIQQIGIDINNVSDMTKSLMSVKGKYIEMQQKVNGMKQLKEQLSQKQQKLNQLKKNRSQKNEPFQIPQSLKTLFKILNLPSNTRPSQYLNNLKKMSKNVQILFPHHNSKTKSKVKQLIDGIRDGRKKFNQVLSIYEGRIQKLQQKISKVKQQRQRKSIQQKK